MAHRNLLSQSIRQVWARKPQAGRRLFLNRSHSDRFDRISKIKEGLYQHHDNVAHFEHLGVSRERDRISARHALGISLLRLERTKEQQEVGSMVAIENQHPVDEHGCFTLQRWLDMQFDSADISDGAELLLYVNRRTIGLQNCTEFDRLYAQRLRRVIGERNDGIAWFASLRNSETTGEVSTADRMLVRQLQLRT